MTFCVQEAYDRNCHVPYNTEETMSANNAEKNGRETLLRHTHTTHAPKQKSLKCFQSQMLLEKEICISGLKSVRSVDFIH